MWLSRGGPELSVSLWKFPGPGTFTLWLCHVGRWFLGQPTVCIPAQHVNEGRVPLTRQPRGLLSSKDVPVTPVLLASSLIGPCCGEQLGISGCLLGSWEEGLVTLGMCGEGIPEPNEQLQLCKPALLPSSSESLSGWVYRTTSEVNGAHGGANLGKGALPGQKPEATGETGREEIQGPSTTATEG